jgi:pimeloyl-ACP methyl ester carboxylesterase
MPAISRDGMDIVYAALGSGPVVVCAHNLLSERHGFLELAGLLAPRARVLLVDLRGHGDSRHTRRGYTVAELAGDLAGVIEGERAAPAIVVGTSLGAAAAVELALSRPQQVRGLVLLAANPRPAALSDHLTFGAVRAVVRALGPGPVLSTLLDRLHAPGSPARSRSAAHIRAMERKDMSRAIAAWAGRPALLGRLGALKLPVRVVAGGADTSCPRDACAALAAELGTDLRVLDGAGHTIHAERPAEVAAIVGELLDRA